VYMYVSIRFEFIVQYNIKVNEGQPWL